MLIQAKSLFASSILFCNELWDPYVETENHTAEWIHVAYMYIHVHKHATPTNVYSWSSDLKMHSTKISVFIKWYTWYWVHTCTLYFNLGTHNCNSALTYFLNFPDVEIARYLHIFHFIFIRTGKIKSNRFQSFISGTMISKLTKSFF